MSFDEAIAHAEQEADAAGEPGAPPEPPAPIEVARTPQGERRGGVTESEEIDYELPSDEVLTRGGHDPGPDNADREAVAKALLETLGSFGVEAKIVGTVIGPHVSRYELRLAPGTKVAKVTQLKDDLAYALASTDIRILAPIPGKQAIGVEVPNQRRRLVRLGDIYQGRPQSASPIVGWLGKDIAGHAVWTDLAKMPHVLVAGTTGSGKSGCVNAILTSILLHASPNEVRLVLVDPKRVELNHYEHVPHLLTPVVTNPRLAANVLQNLIVEMESRYEVMGNVRARNLVELNRARKRTGEPPLPHVLCVIDELADLMMVAPAEVEDSIIRLAQKSRAVGIHLVLATQRPSTDVITGTIKVNIPARIAFAVASQVDSRVILDQGGAETLLGQGDMLFRPAGTSKLQRIQGALVTEEEIARVDQALGRPGRAGVRGGTAGGPRRSGGRAERWQLPRRGRPAGGGRAARGLDPDGLGIDASTPPAGRVHARREADRHAGAARGDLRIRGLEAAPGARRRGRAGAGDGAGRRPAGPPERARARARHRRRARTGRRAGLSQATGQCHRQSPRSRASPGARRQEYLSTMATRLGSDDPLQIGAILAQTRERLGLELPDVEQRTKIRVKYLRALEDEDWEVLPAPAYTRGFLRAYAEELGLDSEPWWTSSAAATSPRPGRSGFPSPCSRGAGGSSPASAGSAGGGSSSRR